MANTLYTNARVLALSTGLNLGTTNVKALLVRTGMGHYVFSAADVFLSAVAGGDQIAKSGNLASKSITGGAFDAADVTWTAVAAGPAAGAIIIYQDVDGTDANAILVEYRDADAGMPVTPSGADITMVWDGSPNYIFHL